MNKKELIGEVAEITKMKQKEIDEVLKVFVEVVKETLYKDGKITFVGFGTFLVRQRKATTGVNPRTKEKINIPAKRVAKLKFSDVVNSMLN